MSNFGGFGTLPRGISNSIETSENVFEESEDHGLLKNTGFSSYKYASAGKRPILNV